MINKKKYINNVCHRPNLYSYLLSYVLYSIPICFISGVNNVLDVFLGFCFFSAKRFLVFIFLTSRLTLFPCKNPSQYTFCYAGTKSKQYIIENKINIVTTECRRCRPLQNIHFSIRYETKIIEIKCTHISRARVYVAV